MNKVGDTMMETLVGGAITLVLMVGGAVLHLFGRVTKLEVQQENSTGRLEEIRDDVKGIGTKLDTVIMSMKGGA